MAETPEDESITDDEFVDLVDEVVGSDDESAEAPDDETPLDGDEPEGTEEIEASEQTEVGDKGDEEEPAEALEEEAEPAPQLAKGEKPFQFKASGAEHAFEGAYEQADGTVRLDPAGAKNFRGLLGSYVEQQRQYKENTRNLRQQLERATKDRSDKDIEADAVVGLFKDIEKMSPEERWAWAEGFKDRQSELALAVKEEKLKRDQAAWEREKSGPAPTEEEQSEQQQATITTEVNASLERILAHPDAKFLTAADRQALREKWLKRGSKLVTKLEKDDPVTGAKKGQFLFDDQDIVDDFADRVGVRQEAAKLNDLARKNAALNGKQQIPPTVRGGKPAASGGKKKVDVKDRKKFKKAFLRGDLDAEG